MNTLDINHHSVIEAIQFLRNSTISDEQKVSYLQDCEWTLEEIIDLALMAGE